MPSGDTAPNPQTGLTHVQTLADMKAALDALRGARSYKTLTKAEPALRQSTLSDLLRGTSVPSLETMVAFLSACGLDVRARSPWLAAWERIKTAHLRKPAGTVRVRDSRARLLGVHASIQVDPGLDTLPVYVPRDLDLSLRTALTAAATEGGFVLLCGGSSVGKTRALFEGVRAVVPEWWLLHPADAVAVRAFSVAPTPRTVVWLDELQRYLAHPDGLPVGAVRSLVTGGVLVVGTLWPEVYAARVALRVSGGEDRLANDGQILDLARVIVVPEAFSSEERCRAEELAGDERIRIALDSADVGLPQALAAGPELVRWWAHADATVPRQCYGKAAITAALDARRVGANAPLTRAFLEQAAPAYLSGVQQATAPPDWLDQAIAYATTRLRGAASCLTPMSAGMGRTAGWVAADYLHQHARQVRRTVALPEQVWRALAEHHNPIDSRSLAESAVRRNQGEFADLFRQPEAGDNRRFVDQSPDFLIRLDSGVNSQQPVGDDGGMAGHTPRRGGIQELRRRADANAGDSFAHSRLADLLVEQGDVAELRQRTDAGDLYAANRLVYVLARRGDVAELRERADAGTAYAAGQLAFLLAEWGDEAELRERDNAGDMSSTVRLADLLVEQSRLDEAIVLLRQRAPDRYGMVASRLADLLARTERVGELRQRADGGDLFAAGRLVRLLAQQARIEELEHEVHAGTLGAAVQLIQLRSRFSKSDPTCR